MQNTFLKTGKKGENKKKIILSCDSKLINHVRRKKISSFTHLVQSILQRILNSEVLLILFQISLKKMNDAPKTKVQSASHDKF